MLLHYCAPLHQQHSLYNPSLRYLHENVCTIRTQNIYTNYVYHVYFICQYFFKKKLQIQHSDHLVISRIDIFRLNIQTNNGISLFWNLTANVDRKTYERRYMYVWICRYPNSRSLLITLDTGAGRQTGRDILKSNNTGKQDETKPVVNTKSNPTDRTNHL